MKNNTKSFEVLSSRLCELIESEAYTTNTIRDMKFILKTLSSYMDSRSLVEYTPEIGERFIAHCISELRICSSRISRAKNIVGKLNRLLQGLDGRSALLPDISRRFDLPDNLAIPLQEYLAHCVEQGNRQNTINYKHWICSRFLESLMKLGCTRIQDVTGEHVQTAFLALGFTRYWERIGLFLRFLFESGHLEQNYSRLIQRHHNPMPQPTVYSPEEIAVVESSFDLSTPTGIRNYAITLLMTRYGIRACDVAALTLNDIDFENDRLHFTQQKTGDPWEGELLPEVKAALQGYLENVRWNIAGCTGVFVSLMPPYAPIDYRAINTMVGNQFKYAKVDIAGRRHGSRAFRSSVASNMINDGVSTEVVRRVLGHGTKHALKHYARIDIESRGSAHFPSRNPQASLRTFCSERQDLLMFNSIFAKEMTAFLELRRSSISPQTFAHDIATLAKLDHHLAVYDYRQKDLSEEILFTWIRTLSEKSKTVAEKVLVIRNFVRYLNGMGGQSFLPDAPKVKSDYIPYIYSDEELLLLIHYADNLKSKSPKACCTHLSAMIPMILRILYGCGTRLGETMALRRKDIDFKACTFFLRETKYSKERRIPVHDTLIRIMERYCLLLGIMLSPEAYLFPGRKPSSHLTTRQVQHWFSELLRLANIDQREKKPCERGASLHCYRHVFVLKSMQQLEAAGHPVDMNDLLLPTYLGHDRLLDTDRYMRFSGAQIPESLDAFEAFTTGLIPKVEVPYEDE